MVIQIAATAVSAAAFVWAMVCMWRVIKAIEKQKSGKGLYKQWAIPYVTTILAYIVLHTAGEWGRSWQGAIINGLSNAVYPAFMLGLPMWALWRMDKKRARVDRQDGEDALGPEDK